MFLYMFSIYGFSQPAGYGFGKQILIQSSQVSGATNLVDFPLLVSFTDTNLRTTSNGGNIENANGYDIVFTLGNCNTLLDHQIEKYEPTTGEYIAWVKIPTLSVSHNTNIHMYYGNSSVIVDPSTTNVWDANHGAVYHMNQSPAGASPQLTDYSANSNDGIANGTMIANDLVTGKIGDAIDFDGSNDFIDCGADASTDPSGSLTLSAWIYSRAASGHIINRGGGWDDPGYSMFHLSNRIRIELQRSGEKDIVDNGISINTWHYVAVTYNFTTGTIRCLIDGIQQGNTGTHTGPIGLPVENLNLGRKEQNGYYFNGVIDEARIIHSFRNNDWIQTEYNNQNVPNLFYIVSSEMTASTLCNVLPIKLLNFNVKVVDKDYVLIDWQTASEINNDYFTIERSFNGIDWEELMRINGAGNSSYLLNYSEIDYTPYNGISYYRLKQTDFDGKFEYSEISSVNVNDETNFHIFPNPANNQITILAANSEFEEITIYNSLGQNVTILTQQNFENEGKLIIDLSKLSSGIYYLKSKTTAYKVYKQ